MPCEQWGELMDYRNKHLLKEVGVLHSNEAVAPDGTHYPVVISSDPERIDYYFGKNNKGQ